MRKEEEEMLNSQKEKKRKINMKTKTIYDLHEEMYQKMLSEKEEWQHFLELRTGETVKISDFHLGKEFHYDGYTVGKKYGLWLTIDNVNEYWDAKIIKIKK